MALLIIIFFLGAIFLVNLLAMTHGYRGHTAISKALLVCGVLGMLSLCAMAVSGFLLGMMLIAANIHSPQGFAFTISSSICAIATLGSALLLALSALRDFKDRL